MDSSRFKNAGILTLIIVVSTLASWEVYLRSSGFPVSFDDDAALWSTRRIQVYKPSGDATVFIGSSRIKFDLDIPTWEISTGNKVIQLSMVGTSPRPFLDDLANDNRFKGKLIIDVTEGSFFNRNKKRAEKTASEFEEFYKKWTPAQRFSSYINRVVESAFVFLEKNKFSLNALLDDLPLIKRTGVMVRPVFPKGFSMNTYERQSFMDEEFLRDTSQQKQQQRNWVLTGSIPQSPAITADTLLTVFKEVKNDIDKIKSRGGQVLFVRTPSSETYKEAEKKVYPRERYWDALLTYTNTPGIHFEDYPETASFICPEWSHLSPRDAVVYTKSFIKILVEKQGWVFPKKNIQF
jgi:hypothetical protein